MHNWFMQLPRKWCIQERVNKKQLDRQSNMCIRFIQKRPRPWIKFALRPLKLSLRRSWIVNLRYLALSWKQPSMLQSFYPSSRQGSMSSWVRSRDCKKRQMTLGEKPSLWGLRVRMPRLLMKGRCNRRLYLHENMCRIDKELQNQKNMLSQFMESFNLLGERIDQLEQWYEEPQPPADDDEELIPTKQNSRSLISPVGSQGFLTPVGSAIGRNLPPFFESDQPPRAVASIHQGEEDSRSLEERTISFKEAASLRLPALPENAGALRQWKNTLVPMLNSLDKSAEGRVYYWLMEAFQAKTPFEIQALKESSGDFPKLDRMVCSWLTRGEALKGQFGPRIQSYIEMSITNHQVLRGRLVGLFWTWLFVSLTLMVHWEVWLVQWSCFRFLAQKVITPRW